MLILSSIGLNTIQTAGGGGDVTPAGVNWANITENFPTNSSSNSDQTITGIDTSITLSVVISSYSEVGGTSNTPPMFEWNVNSSNVGADSIISDGPLGTFSVSNGNTINFTATVDRNSGTTVSFSVGIYNASDANTLLDSFSVAFNG